MKAIQTILSVLSIIFCAYSSTLAEEQITIATYYPSPYGSYNQLLVDKLGVGDNNSDGSSSLSDIPTTSGNVWIKGSLGIGTTDTPHKLTIGSGSMIVKDTFRNPAYYLYKGDSGLATKYFGISLDDTMLRFLNAGDSYSWSTNNMVIDGGFGGVVIGSSAVSYGTGKLRVLNGVAQAPLCLTGSGSYAVRGIADANGSNDWAGYFDGKVKVTGNVTVMDAINVGQSATINNTLFASTIDTNTIYLQGDGRSSWPQFSCRSVRAISQHDEAKAQCANDEFLTGGGCLWLEVQTGGDDNVKAIAANTTTTNGATTQGETYMCDTSSGNRNTAIAICCKIE